MNHVFKRNEEKYILPASINNNIRKLAEQSLNFSEFNQKGSLTDIRTTYLENDDYLIYHMKKSRKNKRVKIRIREYGKNGNFEQSVWIELKEKIDGQGYKSRFQVHRRYVPDFLEGKDIFHYVKKYNTGIDSEYLSVLNNRIQKLILDKELYPRLVIQYKRLAFEGNGARSVRITMDSQLKAGLIYHKSELFQEIKYPRFFDNNKSVVELKYGSEYPDGVKFVKKRFQLKKQKFSKFIFGMETMISHIRPSSFNEDDSYVPFSDFYQVDKEYAI